MRNQSPAVSGLAFFFLALALTGASPSVGQTLEQRVPVLKSNSQPTTDLWLSQAFINTNGGGVIPPALAALIPRLVEHQGREDDCVPINVPHLRPALPGEPTLASFASQGRHLLAGTVVARIPGLYYTIPAQLLEVIPATRFDMRTRTDSVESVLVAYPGGTVELPGITLCSGSDRLPKPPDVGDRLIFWDSTDPADRDGLLHFPIFEGVAVAPKETNSLQVSRAWRTELEGRGIATFDALVNELQRLLTGRVPQ